MTARSVRSAAVHSTSSVHYVKSSFSNISRTFESVALFSDPRVDSGFSSSTISLALSVHCFLSTPSLRSHPKLCRLIINNRYTFFNRTSCFNYLTYHHDSRVHRRFAKRANFGIFNSLSLWAISSLYILYIYTSLLLSLMICAVLRAVRPMIRYYTHRMIVQR